MLHFKEKDLNLIRVAKVKKNITREDLSERLFREVQFLEGEEQNIISDDDFQTIISETASAWAIRKKEDGTFLKDIFRTEQGSDIKLTWSRNLRDALVVTERDNAQSIAYALLDSRQCEPVPLIFQVDPFFESEE